MGMRHINFDLDLQFDDPDARWFSEQVLLFGLTVLAARNVFYLRAHPDTPKLYDSGVVYRVPEQLERRASAAQIEELRKFLATRMGMGESEIVHHVDLARGVEIFRDIPRIIENGSGDCFPLTQKIITRSKSTHLYELLALGELRLVYPSYEALSYNFAKARYEFRDIVGFVDKGVKPVIKAHLSNGADIVATADHKFWTLDGRDRNKRRFGTRTMGEFAEVMRSSRDVRTARARILQAARIPVLGEVCPGRDRAYLAGIYAAEGYFDGNHTNIAQHKPKVRARIEAALAEVGTGFRYRAANGKTPESGAYYALHGGAANPIVAMMREQGRNSFDMELPIPFLSGDEETLCQMVEGHGDGDAWRPSETAFKRPGVRAIYATSSDALMEQLRFALLALGRPSYAYRYADHGGTGREPIWRLHEYEAASENSKLRKRREIVERDLPGLTYGIVLDARDAGEAHVGCIEVEGTHNFVLADGTIASNCDNLAAWCAAERVVAGVKGTRPRMTSRVQDGRVIYHALVLWPDGSTEDPSRILGMGGQEKADERREECRKNVERYDNYWQNAKRLLSEEHFVSEDARRERAAEYKARIDAIGLIPKDGVFRVGRRPATARITPKSGTLVGIDALCASRRTV